MNDITYQICQTQLHFGHHNLHTIIVWWLLITSAYHHVIMYLLIEIEGLITLSHFDCLYTFNNIQCVINCIRIMSHQLYTPVFFSLTTASFLLNIYFLTRPQLQCMRDNNKNTTHNVKSTSSRMHWGRSNSNWAQTKAETVWCSNSNVGIQLTQWRQVKFN